MLWCKCRGQKVNVELALFPSTLWDPETALRWSGPCGPLPAEPLFLLMCLECVWRVQITALCGC